jgi:competence protein ComGC
MKNMNNLMHYQKGMTALGWLIVISIISFFALIVIKLLPVYMGDMEVNDALISTVNQPEAIYFSKRELRQSFAKRMLVSSFAERIDANNLQTEKLKDGTRNAILNYEARINFAGNIFIVVVFDHKVAIPRGK